MKKERKSTPLSKLVLNEGQLGWLPRNPRQWGQDDVDKTVKSIIEDPDYLEDRPLLVVPMGALFVIFAGNLRGFSAPKADLSDVPCVIYYPVTDEDKETVKRRAMKDNGSFGRFDSDIIADEWDYTPEELVGYGLPDFLSGQGNENTGGPEENTAKEDGFNEEEEEIHVICKRGDIWQLGDHRLMCGDSIDLQEVNLLMGGG